MDEQRFDNLTRLLGSGLNRRKVLRGLIGGAGALAVGTAVRPGGVGAQTCRAPGEICQNNPGEGNNCCPGLICSDDGPGNGTCSGCPEGQYFCAASEACINNGACCTSADCASCEECEGGICAKIAGCCASDSDCEDCQECEGGYCVDLSCGSCSTCGNHTCTPIPNCCVSDRDCGDCEFCEGGLCADLTCGPCESCGNHTCTPYAEFCIEDGGYCYNTGTGECCYDNECGNEVCIDRHCCPPGHKYCPDGDYCYSEAVGGCCTDSQCYGEYCIEGECQACRTDADCPDCSYCSEGTCYGECGQHQECCNDECVKIGTCCRGVGDWCGQVGAGWDQSEQLDCCDGLVCCENWNSQGAICAECCNDWDCDKGAYCHEGWCKWPDEECDHDKDCPKGTCCCKDGSCSGKCCDHHHPKPHPKPKPPKPAPDKPVTTLPATGAGPSDEKNGLLGATALGAAAALYAAKKMRETPEVSTEE